MMKKIAAKSAEKALTALSQYMDGITEIKIYNPRIFDFDIDSMSIKYGNGYRGYHDVFLMQKDRQPYMCANSKHEEKILNEGNNAESIADILHTLKHEISDASLYRTEMIHIYMSHTGEKHMIYTEHSKDYDFPGDIENAENVLKKELNAHATEGGMPAKKYSMSSPGEIKMDKHEDITIVTIDLTPEKRDVHADIKNVTAEEYLKDYKKYIEDYGIHYGKTILNSYDLNNSLYKTVLKDNIEDYDTVSVLYEVSENGREITREPYLKLTTHAEVKL